MATGEMGRVEGERELAELGIIVGWAFGSAQVKATEWLARGGLENVRVVRASGRVIAGLLEIPMGQWFRGRSVPLLGIAGVAVSPDARGHGVALALMQSTLRDARARGLVLSALYPATNTLYRALGYELAGSYYRYSMPASDCPRERSDHAAALAGSAQQPEIVALYDDIARQRSGYLDRGAYLWNRVREPHEEAALGVVVRGASGGIEGYAYLNQRPSSTADYDLTLSDLVARNGPALTRLLRFLAEHRSTAGSIVWRAGLSDASLFAFKERVFKVLVEKYWMLRVLDVEEALALRGYPKLDAQVTLSVEDELLPENTGHYRLSVQQGLPHVERVQRPGVRLGVRGLAALYTGFSSAEELERAGLLVGDADALATLSLLFGGAAPTMVDYF